MISVHIHAAQCLNAGLGVLGHERELRECLKKFTVSSEINFRDPVLTLACYKDIVVSSNKSKDLLFLNILKNFRQPCVFVNNHCMNSYFL